MKRIVVRPEAALASPVFLDAVVVRSLLLPSVLQLLGPRTWWMPDWLRRRAPQISIDAEIPTLSRSPLH